MSYITTANQYITVGGNQIAYRELSKGKSEIPLVMLVHLAAMLEIKAFGELEIAPVKHPTLLA